MFKADELNQTTGMRKLKRFSCIQGYLKILRKLSISRTQSNIINRVNLQLK